MNQEKDGPGRFGAVQSNKLSHWMGYAYRCMSCHEFQAFPVSFNAFLSHVIRYHRCVVHPSLLILTHNILWLSSGTKTTWLELGQDRRSFASQGKKTPALLGESHACVCDPPSSNLTSTPSWEFVNYITLRSCFDRLMQMWMCSHCRYIKALCISSTC